MLHRQLERLSAVAARAVAAFDAGRSWEADGPAPPRRGWRLGVVPLETALRRVRL